MAIVKVAGVKSGYEKKPSWLVVTVRTKPFSWPVSVTLAFGITAPAESWTVPASEHEIFWAGSKAGNNNARSSRFTVCPLGNALMVGIISHSGSKVNRFDNPGDRKSTRLNSSHLG